MPRTPHPTGEWSKPGSDREEELVRLIHEPVRQFLLRVLHDHHDADDATSLTVLKVLERHREGVPIRAPVAYALSVAWTRAVDVARRRGRAMDPAPVEPAETRTDAARLAELREWIQAGFDALDPDERAILHLRHVEDLSYNEIADVLALPLGTVKRRLFDARNAFRVALSRGGQQPVPRFVFALLPALAGRGGGLGEAAIASLLSHAGSSAAARKIWLLRPRVLGAAALLVVSFTIGALLLRGGADPDRTDPVAPAGPALAAAVEAAPREGLRTAPFAPSDETANAAEIRGRVTSKAGVAIPGATVLAYAASLAEFVSVEEALAPGSPVASAVTDESGEFALAGVPGAAPYVVLALAPGFACIWKRPVPARAFVELRCGATHRLEGEVRDLEGTPVAGAEVRWEALESQIRVVRPVRTAADGSFVVAEVWPCHAFCNDEGDRSLVEVRAEGHAPAIVLDVPDPDASGVVRVRVSIARAEGLAGRIVDAEGGAPLAGAKVSVWRDGAQRDLFRADGIRVTHPLRPWVHGSATADEAGRFAIECVPSARADVGAAAADASAFAPAAWIGVVRPGFAPLVIACPPSASARRSLELRLARAGAVRGIVQDDAGKPLEGVEVRVLGAGGADDSIWELQRLAPAALREAASAVTDAQGNYAIEAVRADAAVTLAAVPRAWQSGSRCATVSVRAEPGGAIEAPPLVVPREPAVIVEVVDEGGAPLAGVDACSTPLLTDDPVTELTTLSRTGADGHATLLFPRRAASPGYAAHRALWFQHELQPAEGPLREERVYLRARGRARALSPAFVPSAEDPPRVRVVMPTESVVAGQVFFEDGSPAAWLTMIVAHPDFHARGRKSYVETTESEKREGRLLQYSWGSTDGAGRFRHAMIPPGPYELSFYTWVNGYRATLGPERVPVAADGLRVVLTNPEAEMAFGEALVTVVDRETGRAIPGARIESLELPRLADVAERTPGVFAIDHLEPGSWRVAATAPGHLRSAPVRLEFAGDEDGRAIEVRIELERGETLSGYVDLGGAPIPAWNRLRFVEAGGGESQAVRVAPDGRFELSGLRPAGRYLAALETRAHPAAAAEAWVVPGNEALAVRAEEGHALRLRLVPGASVEARIAGDAMFYATADRPLEAEQRRLAAGASVEIRSEQGGTVFCKKGLNEPLLAVALAPGRYLIVFETAAQDEERAIDVHPGGPLAVTFDTGPLER